MAGEFTISDDNLLNGLNMTPLLGNYFKPTPQLKFSSIQRANKPAFPGCQNECGFYPSPRRQTWSLPPASRILPVGTYRINGDRGKPIAGGWNMQRVRCRVFDPSVMFSSAKSRMNIEHGVGAVHCHPGLRPCRQPQRIEVWDALQVASLNVP